MQNIANAYWQMGRKKDAETFFLYCIKLSEQQSIDGKCNDIRLYTNLGAMYVELKNYEKADDYLGLAEKTIEKEEIEKLKGLKVLVVNALRIEEHKTHFNLEEALHFIEIIKPEKTYLTHISHVFGFHDAIQQSLPKNVFLAYDNLEITL